MTDNDGLYIRIRTDRDGAYVWEMFSREGQVIASSEPFLTAAECRADAARHEIPISGAGHRRR